MQGPVNVK